MSEEIIKQIPKDISILDISVINTNLTTADRYLANRIRPFALDIAMGKKVGFNFEEGLAKCYLNFEIKAFDKSNEPLGLTFRIGIEFHFKVNGLSKYLTNNGENKKVRVELGSTILAIAYSTARGIVLERSNNTFFNGILLPVIDASEFLLDDSNSFIDNEEE